MKQTTYENIMHSYTAEEWMSFAFFSANVQHVLGQNDLPSQLALYRSYLDYSAVQARLDLSAGWAGACSPTVRQCLEQGAMVVSFHFGQYRLIPLSLLALGYRVCLLVSREVFTAQVAHYRAAVCADWFERLVFLVAEDPRLFFKVRQYRQAGYTVLCYADGGAGAVIPGRRPAATSKVNLGHTAIAARSGFAAMAFLLGSPICILLGPVAPPDSGWILEELAVYRPQAYRLRADYVQQAVSGIYRQLFLALIRYPECWECWADLHSLMPVQPQHTDWPPQDRYILFEKQDEGFLLDKVSYAIYPVDKIKFDRLKQTVVVLF